MKGRKQIMGLYEEAARSYDNMTDKVGEYEGNKYPLAPICHMVLPVDIEIKIDSDGNFISASELVVEVETVDKKGKTKITTEKRQTILPVSESSMGRTNNIDPHALTDQLGYFSAKIDTARYEAYTTALAKFCEYTDNNSVHAIYKYVTNGDILGDLERCGLEVNEKTWITWNVDGKSIWCDKEVFNVWIDYYTNVIKENEICDFYMSNIYAGKGKIISTNKEQNYVGRFLNKEEACSNDFVTTQKAERFLRWICKNEGVQIGNSLYVCWNPKTAKAISATFSFMKDKTCETMEQYKDELKKELFAVCDNKDMLDKVVIVGLNSLFGKRTSVCYYSEFKKSDFYERLAKWDETCVYYNTFEKSLTTVPLYKIIKYAYGTQQGDFFDLDDKVFAIKMQNIIRCRLNGSPITKELAQKLFDKSKNLVSYKNTNRINITNIAAAMVNKYYIDNKKGEFDMANVEEKKMDRSYQFGRLLAIFDRIEKLATEQNDRDTTALKLERRYCDRPLSTAMMIKKNIDRPYLSKLKEGQKVYYTKMINDIIETIVELGGDSDRPLSESFIVGYSIQQNSFFRKKETAKTEEI